MTCLCCGSPENIAQTPLGRTHVWCTNNNCERHQNVNVEYDDAFKRAKPYSLLSYGQGFTLWRLAHEMPKGTAMAELGVYKGGSAMLMRAGNPDAPLYLFDTFTGHPDNDRSHDKPGTHPPHSLGDTDANEVAERVPGANNWIFPGYFPESLLDTDWTPDTAPSLGLVHIDVDIYESVLAGLTHLAPLVAGWGSIVLDDWQTEDCPGVVHAFLDWQYTVSEEWIDRKWTRQETERGYQLVITRSR